MFLCIIPVYNNEEEYNEFTVYVKNNGFSRERLFEGKMEGIALKRLNNTKIFNYKYYSDPTMIEKVSTYFNK